MGKYVTDEAYLLDEILQELRRLNARLAPDPGPLAAKAEYYGPPVDE